MKIICWNMAAGFGYNRDRHARAWTWLNAQGADVALLQEVVPHDNQLSDWGSVVFQGNYQKWGTAVLVRSGGYQRWEPDNEQSWLSRVRGAICLAEPADGNGLRFASVHSDATSFEKTNRRYPDWYADLPSRDGILRCSDVEMWEIEPIAHELLPILNGASFVLGGDLNSALLFDATSGNFENSKLFANLASQGYSDLRLRHSPGEVRTYFKAGQAGYQLDHVFGDVDTERRVSSWRVLPSPVEDLDLSDHAPIEIVIGHH